MKVGLAHHRNLVALAVLESEERQGAVFHVALFVKADGSRHALVTAGFGKGWQVLGGIRRVALYLASTMTLSAS